MPEALLTKADLIAAIKEVVADSQITPDESVKTIAALNAALAIMDKQQEREADITANYETKLKEKDAQLIKILGAFVAAVLIQVIVFFQAAGAEWGWIFGIGGTLGGQFILGIIIVWLKDKAPIVIAYLKKGSDIVKPLLSPAAQAGLDAISKLIDAPVTVPPTIVQPQPAPVTPAQAPVAEQAPAPAPASAQEPAGVDA